MKNKRAPMAAFAAAVFGLLYAYYFIIARDPLMSSILLMLGGLSIVVVFTALYARIKSIDETLALYVLIIGSAGALGSFIHGGYDLANTINPPAMMNMDLPSQIDPRGLLSFGAVGTAILKASWIMKDHKLFPEGLNFLGIISGTLLIIIYLGRLIVLSPANPLLLYPVLLEGFIIGPLWYLWLGKVFSKKNS
jgi:disulfide bond formation protein DsbB